MSAAKVDERLYIRRRKLPASNGMVIVFEELSIKSLPKWKAIEANKDSMIKYFISNNKGEVVAQVRKNNTIAMYNNATKDVGKHKSKGWSLQKCMRFIYLMTLKQK